MRIKAKGIKKPYMKKTCHERQAQKLKGTDVDVANALSHYYCCQYYTTPLTRTNMQIMFSMLWKPEICTFRPLYVSFGSVTQQFCVCDLFPVIGPTVLQFFHLYYP